MMPVARPLTKCPNCGARITPGESTCAFCGAGIQVATAPEPRPVAPTKADRFRALLAHPDYPRMIAHRPSTQGLMRVGVAEFLGSVVALTAIGVITVTFFAAQPVMALVPIAMGILLLVRLVKRLARASETASESLRALPALVVERRELTSRNAPADALQWRALLETSDGSREELEVPDAVAGSIAAGDMGVAYVTSGYLADFRRVDV